MRHSSATLINIVILISTVFLVLALFLPGFTESIALWVVLASVVLIGIPHGAIDHIMAAEIFGLNKTLKDHLLFYAGYLLIMLLVAALWYFLPVAGMALFLIISIYHFGQADMEDFMTSKPGNWIWHNGRGFLIIGLIVFSDPDITYPIMAEAMQIDHALFFGWMPDSTITSGFIIIGFAILGFIGYKQNRFKDAGRFAYDSILLSGLLIITGPLIGFALYFALWHSAGHIHEMQEFFRSKGKSLSLSQFYLKATPFTVVSFIGLAILVAINSAFGLEEQFLSLMFILISVLTLPHMFIVDRMYAEKDSSVH
jgi:beta-carotene 15,15'-dioxygenase